METNFYFVGRQEKACVVSRISYEMEVRKIVEKLSGNKHRMRRFSQLSFYSRIVADLVVKLHLIVVYSM